MFQTDQIFFGFKAADKQSFITKAAGYLANQTGTQSDLIAERLLERERLGSTGMGRGIAIPHARVPGIDRVHTLFAALDKAIDDRPVDLITVLIAPENSGADHLQTLALISRTMRDKQFCSKLRGANSLDALKVMLNPVDHAEAA
mgnify:CR=1 FL=1